METDQAIQIFMIPSWKMEAGTKMTSYTNPSTELGSLLTSGSLWFDGSNANAANGALRVKMYAPSSWLAGQL